MKTRRRLRGISLSQIIAAGAIVDSLLIAWMFGVI